jgi:hypothetical protein
VVFSLSVLVGFGGAGAVVAVVVHGFFDLAGGLGSPWRTVWDVVYCVLCACGTVWGWAGARRRIRVVRGGSATKEDIHDHGVVGGVLQTAKGTWHEFKSIF